MLTSRASSRSKPLLLVDVDGVISLFEFGLDNPPPGAFHTVDGIAHFISGTAGDHLLALRADFELAWCSGWEEKANEYLPRLLGLPGPLPFLTFGDPEPPNGNGAGPVGHWKLDAIEAYAGPRPLAWVDDALTDACRRWAARRPAPTLLVATHPSTGLGREHVLELTAWARRLPESGR